MASFNRKIKEEYKLYVKILNGLKFIDKKTILLKPGSGGHKNWLMGQEKILCVLKNYGYIKIRQSKSLLIDYGFQLFVDHFEKPILRFDADGVTHYNSEDESLPLLEREIRTPHFHKYNEKGKEYAYRTQKLNDAEYEIQNDIHLGFSCFCDENDILHTSRGKVTISAQQEMFPETIINDVHKGVIFP